LPEILQLFGALKARGLKVGLCLANSNARTVEFQIATRRDLGEHHGLEYGRDFLFTSELTERQLPLPRRAVANLFQVSNIFVFASVREVCPNILLEARCAGVRVYVNGDLPCAEEFAGSDALLFAGRHKISGCPDAARDIHGHMDMDQLADRIVKDFNEVPGLDKRGIWDFSQDMVWHGQFKPALERAYARVQQRRVAWKSK
jgi:hypothetical protein